MSPNNACLALDVDILGMPKIAYITNATANSGVGHRASSIKQILEAQTEYKIVHYDIDGSAGKVLKDGDLISSIKPFKGPLGAKSISWIRLAGGIKKDILQTRCDL